MNDTSLKPIFIKECKESIDWSVDTEIKEKLWAECRSELSITPYQECLAINAILPLDVIHFFVCYELKLGLSTGNVEEGYQYNIFRAARCESSDTHHSDSEMFDLISHCMIKVKGTVETKIQMEDYVELWDCITLHYWYNGHGWNPPTIQESKKAENDCKESTGISQSVLETKTLTKEMVPYKTCVLKAEGVMDNECILIDRSWQKYKDLDQSEVIHSLRHCYTEAAGEKSLDYVKYWNCVGAKLGTV